MSASYLHANADKVLTGTLSKPDRKHLKIIAWPDADLNGDFMSTKSTDGFFVELAGREGRGFPLAWGSHKQGSTAMHTAEAETVSLAQCCRQELIPLQILVQVREKCSSSGSCRRGCSASSLFRTCRLRKWEVRRVLRTHRVKPRVRIVRELRDPRPIAERGQDS